MSRDHDNGQSDHNNHRYEPPHRLIDDVLSWGSSSREGNERNRQYNAGWKNACDQAKRK